MLKNKIFKLTKRWREETNKRKKIIHKNEKGKEIQKKW